jgi:hypothetical protein
MFYLWKRKYAGLGLSSKEGGSALLTLKSVADLIFTGTRSTSGSGPDRGETVKSEDCLSHWGMK